jgi:hypothetical protein
MRNKLYPYSMAQYIRPGSNTFLTQNGLGVPFTPRSRTLGNLQEYSRKESELERLLAKARRRIAKEEAMHPKKTAREDVLAQIENYRDQILNEEKWSEGEKRELETFLDVQRASWTMVRDDLGSEGVKERKEEILLKTWMKFTEGMTLQSQKAKSTVTEEGLKHEPSTSGDVIQGDVKVLKEGIETPIGVSPSATQTAAH